MMSLDEAADLQELALQHEYWQQAAQDEEFKAFLIKVCKLCDSYHELTEKYSIRFEIEIEKAAKELNQNILEVTAKLEELERMQ